MNTYTQTEKWVRTPLDWPHRRHLSADARRPHVLPPLCNRRMKAIVLHFAVTMAWGEALGHAGTDSVLQPAAESILSSSSVLPAGRGGARPSVFAANTSGATIWKWVNSYKLVGIKYQNRMVAGALRWFPCGGSSCFVFSFLLHILQVLLLQEAAALLVYPKKKQNKRKKNWKQASLLCTYVSLLRLGYFN